VDIDRLVAETENYVGADIEALVRQAKLQAMREFISVMAGKGEQEMEDAISNVRLTRMHFEEAQKKVRGSLDRDTLEASERQSWEMLYNSDQREILENAVAALKQAELRRDSTADIAGLRDITFARTKDFNEIKRRTSEVEEQLKK
jgi:transitional endoplasmic reticulum ATPase